MSCMYIFISIYTHIHTIRYDGTAELIEVNMPSWRHTNHRVSDDGSHFDEYEDHSFHDGSIDHSSNVRAYSCCGTYACMHACENSRFDYYYNVHRLC